MEGTVIFTLMLQIQWRHKQAVALTTTEKTDTVAVVAAIAVVTAVAVVTRSVIGVVDCVVSVTVAVLIVGIVVSVSVTESLHDGLLSL